MEISRSNRSQSARRPAVAAIVINSRDITDRKRLEGRLMAQYVAARILAEAESLTEAAPMLLQAICESLDGVGTTLDRGS